jgi:arylsulfatase A-like enzyme
MSRKSEAAGKAMTLRAEFEFDCVSNRMGHFQGNNQNRLVTGESIFSSCSLSVWIVILLLLSGCHEQAFRPHIIYIMTDDMGYGDLSCYGQKNFSTPNLDKLASQGVKFVNAYSAAPVCTPTRAAFMTGRYPARTEVGLMEPLRTAGRDSAIGLTSDIPSVAGMMRERGYETALIGKWHLGFTPERGPRANGFDYFFGILSGGVDYVTYGSYDEERSHDLYENETAIHPQGYLTDLITEKSVAFLQQKHDKPFFLSINFTAPHWPWQDPSSAAYPDSLDFTEGGSPAVYAGMMKSLDDGIGKFMQALDDAQLTENTLVIFTNDNGGERYSDNGGLTNRKMTLWEGGIRVPAFMRWPGKIDPGTTTEQVAVTMDWTATILNAGGALARKDFPLDGIDLLPTVTGDKKIVDRTLYWRTFQRTKHKAIRDGQWKYLEDEEGEYLFDLSVDAVEKNDLKAKETEKFEKLKGKLAEWEGAVLKPIPL